MDKRLLLLMLWGASSICASQTCPQLISKFSHSIEDKTIIQEMLGSPAVKTITNRRIGPSGKVYSQILDMDKKYQDEKFSAIYLTKEQRKSFEIFISPDGHLVDLNGRAIDTQLNETERALYVMDPKGHIYISHLEKSGKVHHSSLVAGGPVAAAGEIEVHNGIVIMISKSSGHYKPKQSHLKQFVEELLKRGTYLKEATIISLFD